MILQIVLNQAINMDIDHISSYGLILEPKTQFYNMYRKGNWYRIEDLELE